MSNCNKLSESLPRRRNLTCLCLLVISLYLAACSDSPRKFDSEIWKSGNQATRGSMALDLQNSNILENKSKDDVAALLGPPDEKTDNWWGYGVKTISRCWFWKCRVEIRFDPASKRTVGKVLISD